MRTLSRHLPTGRTLPAGAWERRHRGIVRVLLALALTLPVYGLLVGHAGMHGLVAGISLLLIAVLADTQMGGRLWSSALASTGLCMACAVAVHLSGGAIEAHFMFFVMIIVVSLYEDWRPFLISFGFVVGHHGLMGVIDFNAVYDHPGNPWSLALIHGGFILAASIAAVVSWRMNEDVRAESMRATDHARASDDRFRSAFEDCPVCMAIVGAVGPARGRLVRVNRTLCQSLGYDESGLVGEKLSALFDLTGELRMLDAIDDLLADRTRIHHDELVLLDRMGDALDARLSMSLVAGEGGVRDVIVQIEDVSERNRLERELHDLAEIDPLTGLYNRRRFELELERARSADDAGAVLLADLDGFKEVNDTLGHQAGDEMLIATARALRDRTRSGDIVARLGGDEFAVLIRGVSAHDAALVGAALVARVAEWAMLGEGADARGTTASIGVVAYAAHTELSDDQLLNDADLAMYEAKESGGNRCVVYCAEYNGVEGRASWPDRIRRALADDNLVMYAQPILDTRTGRIARYELLLRMLAADGGLIPPNAFLPIAERRGMIRTIDRWVVRHAVGLLRQRAEDVRLQINISARSLSDPSFLDYIRNELAAAHADPADLVFEITETAAIANFDDASAFLSSLSDLGCGIALDDFGSGFASLHYVKALPFDELKIDGQFIQNLTTNPDDLVLVETLVQLARGLGKRTVAEYVEDAATLGLISDLGVDFAQGYYIGAPVPALPLISGACATR